MCPHVILDNWFGSVAWKGEYNGNLSRNAASMEKCTEIQKKNTGVSWKQCDMSPLLVSMEMQEKTNISQQGRGKNSISNKAGVRE